MPKKDFTSLTLANLLQWQAAAVRDQPDTPPQEACETAPELRSFTTLARGNRIVLVAKLDDGQTFIWDMNPFIAQNLALNILAIGKQMQWLDQNNDIVPTRPVE